MQIGIFVNRDHGNYIPYVAFLSAQISEYDNIHIETYNNLSIFSEYKFYDRNIFLNRYCLLDLDFISKKILNKNYIINMEYELNIPICILSKKTIKSINSKQRIFSYLSKSCKINFTSLDKSIFDCYNDLDELYIKYLKEYFYKNKPIFYNNKIYYIDPKKQFFHAKNTDVAVLHKNLKVIWDNKKQKWIKLTSKELV